jgi:hypothetical protein
VTTITAFLGVFPTAFVGRLLQASVEIVLAAVVLSGSIVVGHDLKEWREWYADPGTAHPWAPTPAPNAEPNAAANWPPPKPLLGPGERRA